MSFLGLGFAEQKHGLVHFTSRTHGMSLRFDWSVHGLNSWIQSFVLRSGTNKATLAAEGFSTIPHLGEKKPRRESSRKRGGQNLMNAVQKYREVFLIILVLVLENSQKTEDEEEDENEDEDVATK